MDRTGYDVEPSQTEGEQLEEVPDLPSRVVAPSQSLRSTIDVSNVMSSLSSASLSLPPRPSSIHTVRNESDARSSPLSTAFSELDKNRPVNKRERTVSWGNAHEERTAPHAETKSHRIGAEDPILLSERNEETVVEVSPRHSHTHTNSSIFSAPFMNEEVDAWNVDAVMNNSRSNLSFLSNTSRNSISSKIQPSLDLNAVLRTSPLETEAETRILRAIEARDLAAKHQPTREHTGNESSIFAHVPPESVSVFTEQNNTRSDEDNVSKETLIEKNTMQDCEKSFLVDRTSKQLHLNQELEENLEIPRGNLRRGATEGFSGTEIVSSSEEIPLGKLKRGATVGFATADEKINSSLEYSVTRDPSPPRLRRGITGGLVEKRPRHRRTDTLEQRLAGLSEAIAVIKGTDDGILLPSGKRINDQLSEDAIIGGGVADALVQNATLILRPNRKPTSPLAEAIRNETSSQHEGETTNHWNKIKTAVKAGISNDPKKTDEEPVGVDLYLVNEFSAPESDGLEKPTLSTGSTNPEIQPPSSRYKKQRSRYLQMPAALKDFRIFLSQKRKKISVIAHLMLMVILPSALISMILFYFVENPPTGRLEPELNKNGTVTNHLGHPINPHEASASWWILYIGVRHVITLSLSLFMQTLVIDFLCLSSRIMVGIFGNLLTLLIVQSKGWPFTFFVWALFNFGLLRGSSPFVQHWLYWQELLGVFNKENPSGNVTENEWNRALLIIVLVVTVLVAIKRLWLGLFLGRKTYANYAGDLANVINKILCLCEVAALARDLQRERDSDTNRNLSLVTTKLGMSKENFDKFVMRTTDQFDSDGLSTHDNMSVGTTRRENSGLVIDPNDVDQQTGGLSQSQKTKLIELLGEWEVPEQGIEVEENPSISAILQFRHSLSLIDSRFMFSIAWGDVSGRDRMVLSSQNVFCRLLQPMSETDLLSFDVLALAAKGEDGSLDRQKLKLLIRLFRPERDGTLSLLQFLKSVDSIYKEAKLLRASVFSSEKIDRAFERAVNIMFYTVVTCITLSQLGFDPLAMFISLSSIILAFAFMIGTASSKMFEGFIFILIRRPYDIGDRIHVSNIESETSTDGSLGWIVKDVDLFTTTVVFGSTNERATLSNGSMASSRIINMARSQNAILMIYNKFPTEVSFEKVRIFEDALRQFVKSRPREWANFIGFRATKVMSDLGYIEYILILQHRDSWQSVTNILSSKAEVSSFCLELTNKLDMRYVSPPLPVDLAYRGTRPIARNVVNSVGQQATLDQRAAEELFAMFEPE